jgi:hypothetical protein
MRALGPLEPKPAHPHTTSGAGIARIGPTKAKKGLCCRGQAKPQSGSASPSATSGHRREIVDARECNGRRLDVAAAGDFWAPSYWSNRLAVPRQVTYCRLLTESLGRIDPIGDRYLTPHYRDLLDRRRAKSVGPPMRDIESSSKATLPRNAI